MNSVAARKKDRPVRRRQIKTALPAAPGAVSGLPDELFAALGTLDADLAAAPGDPDGLFAVGAPEVAVLTVQDPGLPGQIAPVFQDALFQVPGEEPEEIPEQDRIGQDVDRQSQNAADCAEPGEDQADQIEDHRCDEQENIQLVHAVAPVHKAAHGLGKSLKHASEHGLHHLGKNDFRRRTPPGGSRLLYYIRFSDKIKEAASEFTES